VSGFGFLRLAPGAALAALLLAGCSLSVPRASAPTARPSTSTGAAEIPVATPTPGAAGATPTAFDAVHVYSVLAPAVALIIVSTRQGTAEGSGFVVARAGGPVVTVAAFRPGRGGVLEPSDRPGGSQPAACQW